jgi:hypothetical protein
MVPARAADGAVRWEVKLASEAGGSDVEAYFAAGVAAPALEDTFVVGGATRHRMYVASRTEELDAFDIESADDAL